MPSIAQQAQAKIFDLIASKLGDLLAAEGKLEGARASYRRGIEAARRSGSLAFERRLSKLAHGTVATASAERF